MKRPSNSLGLRSLALCSVAFVGCAGVMKHVPGHAQPAESSSSSSTSSAGTSRNSTAPMVVEGHGDAARTRSLYASFTYQQLTSKDATTMFSTAGISSSYNPKQDLANPDPTWLPGWDQLKGSNETMTAILQAAINRTWTAQIHDDYRRYRAAWAELDKDLRPRLAQALAAPDYYARAEALAPLLADLRARADSGKIALGADAPLAGAGLENDIVRAMVAIHHDAHVDFLLGAYLNHAGVDLEAFTRIGRPLADDDIERDLFTSYAQPKGDLFGTALLPTLQQYGVAFNAITWPTSDERDQQTAHARAALIAANLDGLARGVQVGDVPSLLSGSAANSAEPKLRMVQGAEGDYSPLVVKRVAGAVLELESDRDIATPYGCKRTSQLDAMGQWVQDCNYKHVITKHLMTVTFAEAPAVALQAGDVVTLYADLEARHEGQGKVTYQLTGRALATVVRDGARVATYW